MKVIDVEHHCYSKELIEFLSKREGYPNIDLKTGVFTYHKGAYIPFYVHNWTTGESMTELDLILDFDKIRLGIMDDVGIDVAALSSGQGVETLPKEDAVKYARITNDTVAEACRKHPDRFVGSICLPMPYVEESLAELDRAVNELGLKYVHTHSNYWDECLCDEKFIPILAKCEELDIPIFIHPFNPYTDYLLEYGMMFSAAGFGFGVDTMRTSLKLILNGTFDRFPKLKLILGHMGEFFPYIVERLDNRFFSVPDPDVKCKHNFTYYFKNKNILMATSGVTDPAVMKFVIEKFGTDIIMFGSDYPFEGLNGAIDFIQGLDISEEDKEKIFYKNAEKYILKK